MKLSIGAVLLLLNNNVNAFTGVNTDTFRVTRKLVIGNGMLDENNDMESAVARAVSMVKIKRNKMLMLYFSYFRPNTHQERQIVH